MQKKNAQARIPCEERPKRCKMACTDAQTTDLPPVLHPSATAAPALLHGGRIALCLTTAEKVAGQFAQSKGREGPQG